MRYTILLLLVFFTLRSAISAQSTLPPEMVFVEGGTFTMGCTGEQQPGCNGDENPTRLVRIPSFMIGRYEVTQAQWESVIGNNPGTGYGTSPDRPVYKVSYYDCATFCNRLSQQQGLEIVYYFDADYFHVFDSLIGNTATYLNLFVRSNANGYRMPTESEWEYAARGGCVATMQTKYSGSNDLNEVGWYGGNNIPSGTKPVGQKQANALGIFDMSGNVFEWCLDKWNLFGQIPSCWGSSVCSYRSGSWYYNAATNCRVARRNLDDPGNQGFLFGLRLARNAD